MRSKIFFAAALLALAAACPLPAQQGPAPANGTVQGAVVDADAGAALSGVFVRLVEPHRSESTHGDGRFAIANVRAGRYTLVAERIGYQTVTQPVEVRPGAVTEVSIAMRAAAIQLGQLVVTGTATARSAREMLSPTASVSGAELERKLSNTVAATLEAEPGVAVTSVGPATARPVIRGLGGDRILVLEDGQRPGDLSSTSGDHAVAIEALTARRFEVVRGPMSLLYGSSALGGVVNVVRDEIPSEVHDEAHGSLSLQGESVNRGVAGGGFVTAGRGRFAGRAEGSFRNAGDVSTPEGDLENTETRTFSGSAGAAYVNGWGHAGASYRVYDNRYGIPGGFAGGHEGGVDIDMRRHTVRAGAELHPRQGRFLSTLELDVGYTDYRHEELESGHEHEEGEAESEAHTLFAQDMLSADLTARHQQHGPLSQGAAGVRVQYRDVMTGGSLRTPSTYDYTLAGFLVEEIGIGSIRVQAGTRWDWARYVPREEAFIDVGGEAVPVRERTFGSLSGSVGVLYSVRESLQLGASLARAYRTPDFNELYSNGPHLAANSYDVGDPELGEETGVGADAFVRYTGSRFWGEVAAFRNRLTDYIFPSSRGRAELGRQGGRPLFQYTNEDALFTGAEADFELSISRRLVLAATASYVAAKFTSPRQPIALFENGDTTFVAASTYPPLIPPLNGRVALRYERRQYFGSAELRWADEQDRLGDFEERTAAYAVANVSAGVRIDRRGRLHTLTLRVENLLDEAYRNHLSRVKAIMPEPGRNVSLLYRVTF